MESIKTSKVCKHLKTDIGGTDRIHFAHCPECGEEVIALNIVLNLLKEILREIKK